MTDDTRSFAPDLARLTEAADDSFTVRRAYGEPYQHEGHLVIPVAKVWGGIGTGSGGGAGTGSGGGSANGTGSGTGSGSAGGNGSGSGRGTGDGATGGWSRSFKFGSASPSTEGTEPGSSDVTTTPDADAAGGGSPQGSARGDASGDASGELKGDAKGEAKGEAQGEAHGEGQGEGGGGGGGYGLRVKPIGVVVVSAEGARFQPVFDLNRIVIGGQAVGIAIALALGWAMGRRRR